MTLISATRHLVIGGSMLALLAVGGGSAIALAASSDNVYDACLTRTGDVHKVRVNPTTAPTCQHGERKISWNQRGPAGPQGVMGETGPQGVKGDTGPQGPAGPVTITTVSSSYTFSGNGSGQAFEVAICPAGTHPTGGGYTLENGGAVSGQQEQNIEITGEAAAYRASFGYGVAHPGDSTVGWGVVVNFNETSTGSIDAYAYCAG